MQVEQASRTRNGVQFGYRIAYIAIEAATETFSDSLAPNMGIWTISLHKARCDFESPVTSLPMRMAMGKCGLKCCNEVAFLEVSSPIILTCSDCNFRMTRGSCFEYSHGIVSSAPSAVLEISFRGGCAV